MLKESLKKMIVRGRVQNTNVMSSRGRCYLEELKMNREKEREGQGPKQQMREMR